MTAADKIAEALPKAEKLARAMDGVMSGGRSFNRQLAAQIRNELRAGQALADAQAQEIQAAASQAIDRMEAEVRSILADFFRRGVAQEKWEDAAALAARRTRAALGDTP